ncbi:transcriptional regulator [Cellulomonas composti]|uniref:Transcriptional regulator n=2 Tax=Cellulomonas composti TaxID=266130 RepID=A0A511J8W7_9CELL|nr:transcriptional regulator [Cellulomonas composti]
MWDVAHAAGVSQATVSLVLRGQGGTRVSAQTAQRVRDTAKAIGYRGNATARALRDGVAEMVGFIGDQVASAPFAGRIVEGAQDRAWQDDQLLLVANTGGSDEIERAAVAQMLSHQVRRVVYASMYNRPVDVPAELREIEIVVLNAIDPTGEVWSVSPDEVAGGRDAVTHLVEHGHRRIAMINIETLESGLPAALGRHEGYRLALADAGIAYDESVVRFGGGGTPHGYALTHELMALPAPPTAIFCANDRTAWGAYQALAELGLRVPEDVSVVGFDNQDVLAPFMRPALTTMNLPFREMGWTATDLLLTGNATRTPANAGARAVTLRCELVVRESVAEPRSTS